MKKIENVSYSDLQAAVIKNGYQLADSIEECLIDSYLYEKPETEKTQYILIAGFETYVNSWASCLTVYIARTEKDCAKLMAMWEKRKDSYTEDIAG